MREFAGWRKRDASVIGLAGFVRTYGLAILVPHRQNRAGIESCPSTNPLNGRANTKLVGTSRIIVVGRELGELLKKQHSTMPK